MAKRGLTGLITRAYGGTDHEVTVIETRMIAPHFKRIKMFAPSLLAKAELGPAVFLRFWFPDPENPEVEQQRAYTVVEADLKAGTFSTDFVLHEPSGPGSYWAANAEEGSTVLATAVALKRFELPEELPEGFLLIGDSASIPAINAILAELPAGLPVEVYLEQHHPNDQDIALFDYAGANVHWVQRQAEDSLAVAIERRDWSGWNAWVAPEAGSLKHLRNLLRKELGFAKSALYAQAYWYEGRPFGKKR